MRSEPRFVFDTNAIISAALLPGSVPRRALELAITRGKLLLSTETITELDAVLRRKRFDKYLREDERLRFLAALVRESLEIKVTETVTECRDPKDNKFLELAVSGGATCLVTGDEDLLVLKSFRTVAIVTPHEFLNRHWPDDPGSSDQPEPSLGA
jgi:uncharacterized protein